MDTKQNQQFEKETINLQGLQTVAESLQLDLTPTNHVSLVSSFIEAPEDTTFQQDTILEIADGFTVGAVKNIITFSKEKLRHY